MSAATSFADGLHRKMVDSGIPSSEAWAVIMGACAVVTWLQEHEMLLALVDEAAPVRHAVEWAISQRAELDAEAASGEPTPS